MTEHQALTQRVDRLFSEWGRYSSPGAALAVIKAGEVIYSQGYGMANLEYDIPISPSTIFHVASVSKQFTALAAALLADEGRLSLDDDIRDYVPEVPDFGPTITLRHLIHHTSGLRDQWALLVLAGWRMDDVITRDHILKLVSRQRELNFEPGEEHVYSNTGYTLLAEAVARVSDRSFPEFTRERIFEPLGMKDTHFHDDHELIVKNRAYSYAPDGDSYKKQVLSYANVGATSLFTTAEDLARWVLNFDHQQVGGQAVIDQLHERLVLNSGEELDYAFGLHIGEHRGLKMVGHSGGDAGFRTHVARFPDEDFGVVMLSNLATFKPAELAVRVAEVYLEDRMEPPTEEEETGEIAAAELAEEQLTGTYHVDRMFAATIEQHDGGLTLTGAEVEAAPLKQLGKGEYLVKETGQRLEAGLDSDGNPAVSLELRGRRHLAQKADPPPLGDDELREYAGAYFSPELETTYRLSVEEGRLVVQHRKRPDLPILPLAVAEFAGLDFRLGGLSFERDESGQLTGFRVNRGRVRNLLFKRRPDSA